MFNLTDKKILIASSGGPDSMALLDMARKEGIVYAVGHVNYHKRRSANRDQGIVEEYCRKYDIPFFSMDAPKKHDGNFQEYARNIRYSFFERIVKENGLDCVLTAHHMDDLLETYLLQKNKNVNVEYFGLKRSNRIAGVKVIRPLLKYEKKELQQYCNDNNIPYGIDESNLDNHYQRNRIRHDVIEKMSLKDKKILLKEIKDRNRAQALEIKESKRFIQKRNIFNIDELLKFKYNKRVLRLLITNHLSDKFLDDILKSLSSKRNFRIKADKKYIYKDYDMVTIGEDIKEYCVILKRLKKIKSDFFRISGSGSSFEGVTLKESDFPITIRNYQDGDCIEMLYGKKKIKRFFIDNKIRYYDRYTWPVVLNNEGKIILVPGIGCDKYHYSIKHNAFVIKLNSKGVLQNA